MATRLIIASLLLVAGLLVGLLSWWGLPALMVGHYAPSRIGVPSLAAPSAPSATANAIHIAVAGLALAGLIVIWSPFSLRRTSVLGSERA